ncbi:MAG: tripartite tricarboxylate transporter TctB family protein [Planctomycetota bacterium]|jgi:hypothetical protein|nr:tripartite tricarboxylate transporter TctB family protein [Planctomycetota bacterium]
MNIKYRSNLVSGAISAIAGVIVWILVPLHIKPDYDLDAIITSRTLPYSIAALFVVMGLGLLARSLVFKQDKVKILVLFEELKVVAYMATMLIYALFFKYSFIGSTTFLGFSSLAFSGCRKPLYYVIVFACVVPLYFLFTRVMYVRLP